MASKSQTHQHSHPSCGSETVVLPEKGAPFAEYEIPKKGMDKVNYEEQSQIDTKILIHHL